MPEPVGPVTSTRPRGWLANSVTTDVGSQAIGATSGQLILWFPPYDVFPGEPADMIEIRRSLARIQGTGYFSDPGNPLDHVEPTFRFVEVEGVLQHVAEAPQG